MTVHLTPSRIVILGLGPGDPGLRTIGAQRALDSAARIILRTRIHPGLEDLQDDPRVSDCDDLYRDAASFDALYAAIAARVIASAGGEGPTVYAVPGHPRFAERSVPLIEAGAREVGIPCEVLSAVSFVDAALGDLALDPLAHGLQITDAEHLAATVDAEPFAAGRLGIDPARPLLVAQVYNTDLAAAVKIALSRLYPEDHPVTLIQAAGIPDLQRARVAALYALDRQAVDHLTSLYAPPLAPLEAARAPEALTRVVARLRAPGGCPWDREQTHPSLRDALLEEAFEAVDAIDAGDAAGLMEELGDLLLLIAMHAQIAEEDGAFRIEDVYETIARKLIRRHPHVFADVTADTPEAVVATWEGIKAAERVAAGVQPGDKQPIDRLPRSMPALRKAAELLAPRAILTASDDAHAGDQLLAAVRDLIQRGLDPERALDASLRAHVAPVNHPQKELAAASATGASGKGPA